MSAEENKALVRRWFEETDRGNLAAIEEILADDYVDHNPPIPDLPPGPEGIRQANLKLRAAFPDAVHTLGEQIARGDKVMTSVTVRATFTREFLGFPPTGETIELSGTAVHRIAGGRLAEHWAHVDMAGFMRQVGATPDQLEASPSPSGS